MHTSQRAAFALIFGLVLAVPASAQSTDAPAFGRPLETRQSLLALAQAADSAGDRNRASLIRERLRDGDFQEGDRIVLMFEAPPAAMATPPETLVVLSGRMLDFKVYDDISVQGVLRAELEPLLLNHLTQYWQNPKIRVYSLIRLTVLGAVAQQGFLNVPPEMLLTDVLTMAGLSGSADPDETTIRRGTRTIWNENDIRVAIATGYTIDRLHLRAGDQILVEEKDDRNWLAWLQLTLATAAIALSLFREWR